MLPSAVGEGDNTDAAETSTIESAVSIKEYLSQKSEQPPLTGQIKATDETSEKSYDPLFTKDELLESLTFLNFNLKWMFIVALASIILYVVFTFELVFGDHTVHSVFEILLILAISCAIILDIAVIIIHRVYKKMSRKRDITPHNKGTITVDTISLLTFLYLVVPDNILWLQIIMLILCIFRLYRVIRYFYFVSITADVNNVSTLLKKYALLMVLMVHTWACLWQLVGCYGCSDTPRSDWTHLIAKTTYISNFTASTWYIMSMYYTASLVTTVGFGDFHGFTTLERSVSIVMMITGYSFMTAAFLGGWTAVQVEHYRRHAQFSNRIKLIKRYLMQRRIPKYLSRNMSKFYLAYWNKRGAVDSSRLFNSLPISLQQQVHLDTYWFFFQQSHYFRNASDAFKRAIAMVMITEIKIEGEIIYEQGKERDAVTYVASGSVRLHSAEDNESTILTFGIGTLLGESCLTCSTVSPVRVTAASFSVLQILRKNDFWRIADQFVKLNQISSIHNSFNIKLENARAKEETKRIIAGGGGTIKTLKLVRKLLHTENPRTDDGYFHVKSSNDNENRIYSDVYILSRQETVMKHSDEIFSRTIWPWSLHPQSSLLAIWEYIVVITVLAVAILYPYRIVFGHFPTNATVLGMIITVVYILDVVIQSLTSIEIGNVIVSEVPEILLLRMRSFQYVLDIIAALPLVYIARILHTTEDPSTISLLSTNRLFKIQRIFICMNKMGRNFKMNIPLVRMTKYVVILCFVVYFMGSVFYIMVCYRGNCGVGNWWQTLKDEDGLSGVRSDHPFAVSMYFAMMVVSQAGFGDISATNTTEMIWMTVFFAIGVLIFNYLVADLSATLMLADRAKSNFIETVDIIRSFLISNQMLPSIQKRISKYLALQWKYDNGYNMMKRKYLLYEAPHRLLSSVKSATYFSFLTSVPLFQNVSANILKEIAFECKTVFLPPNEMVVYGGEIPREMFIIERGVCLQVNATSGKVEKVLGPHSHFSVVEMLFKQPGLFNIRTVTHVKLAKLMHTDLKKVLASYPILTDQIENIGTAIMTGLTVERLFMRRNTVTYPEIPEAEQKSWFVFPKKKLNPRNFDYEIGFKNAGVLRILKIILLRRTILPNGNFMMFWEIGRAVCAFLTGMVFPLSVHLSTQLPNYIYYIKVLDVFAFADIYIRLHVGYYNKRGILVTHPKYTAVHYLSHAFIIDLLGFLPMQEMLHLFKAVHKHVPDSVAQFYKIQSYLAYTKLLQMYRLPDAFAYFQRDPFKKKSIFLNIMLFVPISVVFINFLASLIVILTTYIAWDEAKQEYSFHSQPQSWYHYYCATNPGIDTAIEVYMLAYYWVTTTCLTLGFGDIIAQQPSEMYFVIFSIIAGYLFFTYVLVVISSSIATINSLLTTYQEHMEHFIRYMNKEKVGTEIQTRVIRHFEHMWQKTHGLTGNFILEKCHMALRQDAMLSLYEQTLLEVPVFDDLGRSFFRLCCIQLHEDYLLKDELVIRLNDIIDIIYIIHKGEAIVKAPDGSTFTVLTRGCMFGNIDNIASSRSMVSIVAESHLDLLAIKTETFYQIASEYPILGQRMKRHVLLENLSYIAKKSTESKSCTEIKGEKLSKPILLEKSNSAGIKAFFYGGAFELIAMLLSFASCIIILYHMCFQEHSIAVLLITYALDVSHIIKIFLGFYKPFRNHLDEIITNRVEIRRRYMAFSRFYVDLFAAIPFELFCLISSNHKLFYLSLLRLNRSFRYYEIHQFFDVKFNRLHINVSGFKLGAVAINFFLMLHVGTCILYLIGCPAAECNKNGWTINLDGYCNCNGNYYFCSFYFMTCIITCNGIGDLHAQTISEMVVLVFLMVCTKFIVAIFIGNISAIVQSYSHCLVNYDHGIVKLKEFLRNNDVSEPLRKRILQYSLNLWKGQKGYQIPVFLAEAPKRLQEEIKGAAFGKHLYENYVFERCHADFLRLLITKLEAQTFFASDIICQQGDINNRMYFIHKGIVEVFSTEEHAEVLVDELEEMDCFGMMQGLYMKTPHNYTFKAATVCVILSLELKQWLLLLRYFPSARYEIYEKLMEVV